MKLFSKKNKGFTLPEVLIGISVLAMAILTATSLFVGITRNNTANMNDLTAYYLASEGLEAVRNIRDTHWLNNIQWTGDSNFQFWGENVDFTKNHKYIVSRKLIENVANVSGATNMNNTQKVDIIRENAPWQLSLVKDDKLETTTTRLIRVGNQYIHADHKGGFTRQLFEGASPFSRYVEVAPVEESDVKTIKVKSVVFWYQNNQKIEMVLETVLTDWKSGPK